MVAPSALTFTPANALTPQAVTLTGVNDAEVDGLVAYAIVTGTAVSGDLNYNGLNPPDVAATNLDNDPIRLEGIAVNNGAAQRSMVKGITVTISQAVTLADGAFTVRRADGATAGLIVTPSVVGGRTVVALTFAGPDVLAGSLADGNYTLVIDGLRVTDGLGQPLDGDGDGAPGGTSLTAFHRLFGDSDGDRDVDTADLFLLRGAFGKTGSDVGFLAYFDSDGDGDVDAADLFRFRQRFGVALPP